MNKERNYGIDLFRLVLMFMVCILHTLAQGGVLKACAPGSINHKVFWFLETVSFCAVDGFALISGYTASDRPGKYEKLAGMWFQVFFYSFVVTLILTVVRVNPQWGKTDVIKCFFPVTFGKFWYFTAYFALFFAEPVLNRFIFSIDETSAKKTLLILFGLFSVLGTVADPFKSDRGYSAIWLMALYCIGALSKKCRLFETRRTVSLILTGAACIIVTWFAKIFFGFGMLGNYVSPTILLCALVMLVLFSRMKIKVGSRIIMKLSPLAFGIYLFQNNQVVWDVCLKNAFLFVTEMNAAVGAVCTLGIAAMIFITGLIVEFIRSRLAKLCRIPSLSKKIVKLIDRVLTDLLGLLK